MHTLLPTQLPSPKPLGLLALGLLWSCAASAAPTPPHYNHSYTADRVVAVGDVHGAFDALVRVLQGNALLDDDNNWSGGSTHLVSLGDLIDRGPRSRDVMDLLRKLQMQARAAGGRVHVVLGNHEVLNLLGDVRDVSDAEFAAFAPNPPLSGAGARPETEPADADSATAVTESALSLPPSLPAGYKELRAAFAPDGDYGAWLLTLPAIVKVNNTLFVHGGLSPALGDRDLATINADAKAQLLAAATQRDNSQQANSPGDLLSDSGPFWYRGTAACHPLLEQPVLQQQLQHLGATRVVVGHTPTATRQPQPRLGQRVFVIDTGMLEKVYRGKPYLLELQAEQVRVLNSAGAATDVSWWHPTLLRAPHNENQLADLIKAGEPTPGSWTSGGRKTVAKALARWRLDRELGLWLTPLTVADADGKRFFEAVEGTWLTDRERAEQDRSYPNYCVQGHQNLLITAFDALLGITKRTQDDLLVHRATGVVRLEFVKQSFGTGTTLPRYATQPSLPPAIARRLRALTQERLRELLGDLLSKRQITAIVTRRDKLLEWPATELQL